MLVRKHLDVAASQEMPGVMKREVINADDGAPNFCMRVFELEPGASTPFHTHPWEHEVYLLGGTGVAVSEKGETPISRDSVIFVPVDEKHCFKNTGKDTMRFICVIPY
ncbi:MAG: cupin domain-containing protein [Spirochaetales bacterium]|nr:cupin domain-containing protein [Spirochaetales bacterium]